MSKAKEVVSSRAGAGVQRLFQMLELQHRFAKSYKEVGNVSQAFHFGDFYINRLMSMNNASCSTNGGTSTLVVSTRPYSV